MSNNFWAKGTTYFIVPRIKDIKDVHDKISTLIDNAFISSVHGRMSSNEIENTMIDFYEGKCNILIATSIIENGLDIPNANTIFIYNADMFGLGQLYQLKGRVGRSDKRAYAYYLLSNKFSSPLSTFLVPNDLCFFIIRF